MKHKLFLCAAVIAACAFSMNVNAQLEVKTSGDVEMSQNLTVKKDATVKKKLTVKGNVAIGDSLVSNNISLNVVHTFSSSTTPYYGIRSKLRMSSSMPQSSIYAICGEANTSDVSLNYPGVNNIVGVYGKGIKSSDTGNRFTAGVAGMSTVYGGIGVFGGINPPATDCCLPTTMPSGYYAGYFNGTVVTNGSLVSTTLSTISDLNSCENVRSISPEKIDVLCALNPISYTLKPDSAWLFDKTASELQNGLHYGLIAQEVQKVYPELVYERADKLSINYIEIIPLLIMKVQELSAEVEDLKKDKAELTYRQAPASNAISEQAVLYQNVPNPFTVDTKIVYQLPKNTRNASLYIYNMNGLQVADYPISSFGEGNIIVSAGSLDAGMYLYSLVADGKVVDTKRMILTK